MDYAKASLAKHYEWRGKIEVVSRAAVDSAEALSLAYTPSVAAPCLEIQKDVNKSFDLTRRWNTVAVVTDGTAVLGLGDIGPEAGMPVMEGKCVLFKAFGDVDAIPLCVRSKDVDRTDREELHAVDLPAAMIHRRGLAIDQLGVLQLCQRFRNRFGRLDPNRVAYGLLLCPADIRLAILQPHQVGIDRDRVCGEPERENIIRQNEIFPLHVRGGSFQSDLRALFSTHWMN